MSRFIIFLLAPAWALSLVTIAYPQETKEKTTGKSLTYLGTVKGEVTKVVDGGKKIEVKYKEMVPTPLRSSSSGGTRSSSGKVRITPPKEFGLKEKNQELELRLLESSVVRLLNSNDVPSESNKSKPSAKRNDAKEDSNETEKEKRADEKNTRKNSSKNPPAKSTEPQLPGKPGDPTSIVKGQIVIVSVAREDLPGFSRLIATHVYILGEK